MRRIGANRRRIAQFTRLSCLEDAQRDVSFHRLSVKVKRKGAKVRARQGYFAEKSAKAKK